MHLRTVTLRGFKSFASATTLHLEPGITCVVGPNGSGKSNVVDALAWVMGEQGAKTLRGGAMSDVIFAGTSSRPPLGRAEVTLTIDNADGALPIAYSEVTISRTLFRNGGSEYAINGTPCRLLDIQELLSDTGMGREMHVIVGQGRLDAVLSATPEERRGFIEEAAGVLKHRRRKDKALRKLESMQANLQRVTDLSTEIRRQLGPLARQADVARRAAVIQSDVRDSRARLLADDLVQAQSALAADSATEEALLQRKAEVEEQVAEERLALAGAEGAAASLSPRLREATDAFYELSSLRERFLSLQQLASERVRHLGSPAAPHRGEEPEELDARAAAAREEESALRSEAAAAAAELATLVESRTGAESAERAAEHALAAVHRGLADRREGLARLTGQVAARRGRLEAASGELGRSREALDAARQRATAAEAEFARLEIELAGAETGEVDLDAAHEAAQDELAAAEAAQSALAEQERDARSRLATATARSEALALSLTRSDATAAIAAGGAPGIRGVLPEFVHVEGGWDEAVAAALGPWADAAVAESLVAAVDALRSARSEDLGTVRIVVRTVAGGVEPDGTGADGTPPDAAAGQLPDGEAAGSGGVASPDGVAAGSPGVAAALADGAAAALADGVDLRLDGAAAGSPGAADALPDGAAAALPDAAAALADGAGPRPVGAPARAPGGSVPPPGGSGPLSGGAVPAASVVAVHDPAIRASVLRLLAGTVLTEDLAAARAAIEADPGLVAVTRAGDVLAEAWASGGSGEAGSSVFALQSAAEDASAEVAEVTRELEAVRFRTGPASERLAAAREQVAATLSDLHASDAAMAASVERLGHLGSAIRAAAAEAERTVPLIERLESERKEHERELEALAERLAIASREPDEAEAELASATERRDAASAVARDARRAETDARLRLRTAEERVAAIAGRAESLRAAAEAERAARRRAEERERRRSRQATVATEARDHAAEILHALERSLVQAGDARAAFEEEREEVDGVIARSRTRLDELGLELGQLNDAAHRDELVRAEQRLRIEQFAEKSVAELGLDPAVLIDEYGPHTLVPTFVTGDTEAPPPRPYVRAEQEARLAKATKDLERLGKVNPLALEEHAALAERHQFLADQLADLKKSRADLLDIVREIDDRVEAVFAEAFADTAAQFETVFPRLFPGGEGRLVLTDPENMLTTGIEIEARPAGKKVKRLSLLSGGERSLTAVALLVAIFMARPSPFYVMDEVEAALDDSNLGRLLEIFQELRRNSQLIVVTHQKRTMEIADVLYGVTMRDGVTSVISQRLAEAG